MLQVNDLSKSYGAELLFSNVTFTVGDGEKVGLIGRNGHGKTTLFRILTQEESPDSGEVIFSKNYRVGYLKQTLKFTEESVVKEGAMGLPENDRDSLYKIEKILFGLGFSKEDLLKHPTELSGGYQVRLNLAKVLVSDCHLLLLDEPTNYLDIISLRWLSRFLRNWPYEVFLITHDREFMDSCISHVVGIHRQSIKKMKGTSKDYFFQIAEMEETYEKTRLNEEKKRKETEEFINKFRAKARQANLAQSRMKALAKQEIKEKLASIEKLEFSFNYEELISKWPIMVKNMTFGYDRDQLLIKNVSVPIVSGDKIAIIGKNGKGKSTLLNLIAKRLSPIEGEVIHHQQLKMAFFGQTNKEELIPQRTIEEEIMTINPEMPYTRVRQICGTMLFSGDKAKKSISVLSGGEKSRVILGKLLAQKSNILLLDEPTNHLDMESVNALKEGIRNFPGTVILVTHNEDMLKSFFNKFVVFQKNKIVFFEGSYEEFLSKVGWEEDIQDESSKIDQDPNEGAENSIEKMSYKDSKNFRKEIVRERSQVLNPLKERFLQIENQIIELENQKKLLEKEIILLSEKSPAGAGEKISEISKRIGKIDSDLETLDSEFEQVGNAVEEKEAYYNKLIK